jgi:N-glycosylase/DNA lyase
LLVKPANMFQFINGAVLGTGLINQTDTSLQMCNSTINYNIIGSGEAWWPLIKNHTIESIIVSFHPLADIMYYTD